VECVSLINSYFAQQLENIEALGLAGFACESFVVEKTTDWGN
jgi:hypothetical protein